ncbi:hypothetical protein BDV93DRAFT_518623 [Ceratobasidium sp. AG-I]|nr:hypothetical protein BDV93DRAFT_518623 [Ceratobasidium sp. AG-I]
MALAHHRRSTVHMILSHPPIRAGGVFAALIILEISCYIPAGSPAWPSIIEPVQSGQNDDLANNSPRITQCINLVIYLFSPLERSTNSAYSESQNIPLVTLDRLLSSRPASSSHAGLSSVHGSTSCHPSIGASSPPFIRSPHASYTNVPRICSTCSLEFPGLPSLA